MAVTLPSTPLATQADLNASNAAWSAAVTALAARVSALEHATPQPPPPPPPVNKPSADGSFVTGPGNVLTDKNLAGYSLVADTVRPANRIARNGATDPVTGNVSKIGIYSGGQCFQWATGGVWVADLNGAWTQTADPTVPVPPSTGYHVAGGKLLDSNGNRFFPKGVNIWGDYAGSCTNATDGGNLLNLWPKVSMVRFNCWQDFVSDPGKLDAIMTYLTGKGVVCFFDIHETQRRDYVWDQSAIDHWAPWVQRQASTWKNNPRVWLATANEPQGDWNLEMTAFYNLWRGQGNTSPVIIGYGGQPANETIAPMTNVVFDIHYYSQNANHSGNIQDHYAALKNEVGWLAPAVSKDGRVPVLILEFGDGCCGAIEQNGLVAVQAVCTSTDIDGWTAFQMTPPTFGWDDLNEGAALTRGGQIVHDNL